MRQITVLGKLKHESLALEKFVQDNLDLMLVNNLFIDLNSY